MSSAERMEALLQGKLIDRVPFLLYNSLGFCAKNVGYTIADMYTDQQKSFDAQVYTMEQYGCQIAPSLGYASYGAWEFGGEVKLPGSEGRTSPAGYTFTCSVGGGRLEIEVARCHSGRYAS